MLQGSGGLALHLLHVYVVDPCLSVCLYLYLYQYLCLSIDLALHRLQGEVGVVDVLLLLLALGVERLDLVPVTRIRATNVTGIRDTSVTGIRDTSVTAGCGRPTAPRRFPR